MELRNDIDEIEDIEEIENNNKIQCIDDNKLLIKKEKKKGFTLVELIAVIAILAILGAIIVPQIFGYMTRADRSKVQTDATIVLSAVQAYNADNSGAQIGTINAAAQTSLGTNAIVPAYLIKATPLTVDQLTIIAGGGTGFTVTKTAGVYTVSVP